MKTFVILALVLLVQSSWADSLGDEVAALKIKFPPGKHLSSNELRQVLELAHQAGMKRVAEIGAFGSQWDDGGLFLTSAEIKQGRRISREELLVHPLDWRRDKTQPHRSASGKTLGNFALGYGPVYSRQWVMFTVDGKETRIECPKDSDLTEADKALAALLAGRVEYSTPEARSKAASMNFHAPRFISVRAGQVYIGFAHHDSLCGYSIRGRTKEGKLVIETASEACA